MADRLFLVVGLGNPGPKYARNRHNIGFMAADAIVRRWAAKAASGDPWRRKFQGDAADAAALGAKALVLKPMTYMNESGRAVGEAMRFHKIALEDVIVFHDELDLAPAKLRVKRGGGNAGHNGLRSISAHCGNDYLRVRMGIGHPGDKAEVHNYVLNDFARSEEAWVEDMARLSADLLPKLLSGEAERFQSDMALELKARGHGDVKPVGAPSA
ncbi:MAG: aminoacyl-tRNA hydrolase [Beijerinckiaceae bacterium]